ncbi:muscle-specific protein 300 kDa-like [Dreissena polymorpha]|uniref:muscle-specific protein 300 kDa-like n=1 Tax=Dreissena polymorpha TaxID=45954 RepID=UPI002264915F|nr:muscle-specific protein 300 kDa-like [Dreissena polymorpha]
MAVYHELLTWCQTEAEEVLQIVEQPVTPLHQEYMDYLAFKAEVDRRGNIYNKKDEKIRSGKSVKLTPETFKPLEETWKKVARQTRLWLWKLDASLPGKLGKSGDWLNQAEDILELEKEFLEDPNEMAMQLGKILQDHRTFFKELEPQKTFFQQVRRAGKFEGTQIPAPQMDNLHQRLTRVCTMAPQRERRLEYEEMKHQLLAFLVASENKLKIWTVKYGHQPNVEALLADYKNFVHSGNLFKNYDQTYETCKRNGDAYRKTNDDKTETEKMNAYFDEVNGRWKKVSVEIKSVQSMVEEVIDCWRKYNACVDVLTVLLNDGERVMSRSADEKQQFFADLANFEEKHKILIESGNFLIETTKEPVAAEIKTTLLMVNRRLKDLVESFQHFKKVEVVGKARKDYNDGLLKLTQWLKGAEELFAREVPCKHAVLRDYLNDLETLSNQIPAIENDFKTTTKTAQSLVKECSQDVVNEMLQSLNIQKEVIVRLRKEIQEKTKNVKAVLPNIESLENGLMDLDTWLSRGEALLESHKLDGTQEETEQWLEKHKAFFSEITYQKSILDSKNKVHQKVESSKPKLENIDFSVTDGAVEELNHRFHELQQTLNKLKGSLSEVQKLNAIFCEGASRKRCGPLKGERLNHFCDWLNEKEEKLNAVNEDKTNSPEKKLEQAKAISTEVYENHITLENLEKDAKGLSQNFRSRETAALKAKLSTVRRQWESLCARANDHSSSYKTNVEHWQMYQILAKDLMPWIVKAEKYCATELPKCSSLEEAKELYALHQSFLNECEENISIFEKMTTEAGYLLSQPNMQKELDTLQRR